MRGVVRWCVGGALVLGVTAGVAAAQTRPEVRALPTTPESAIYVGNSFFYYNNSMHSHVRALMRGMGMASFTQVSVAISGSGFDWHDVASYFRPNAVGSYTFDDDNNIVFNRRDRLFDAAILMDCSQCPIHPRLSQVFTEYARRHAETVRANGARPVFFMSWAYADKPEMTAQLAEAYTAAGNANGALVIPAGLAFARSVAERPSLNLYVADKRHPSRGDDGGGAHRALPGAERLHGRAGRRNGGVPAGRRVADGAGLPRDGPHHELTAAPGRALPPGPARRSRAAPRPVAAQRLKARFSSSARSVFSQVKVSAVSSGLRPKWP